MNVEARDYIPLFEKLLGQLARRRSSYVFPHHELRLIDDPRTSSMLLSAREMSNKWHNAFIEAAKSQLRH